MSKSAQNTPHALIVGVAGFVGSYLAESLCAQNVRVTGIDILLSGNKRYLDKLKKQPLFNFVEHNINNGMPANLTNLSIIVHAAGIEEYLNSFDVSLDNLLVNAKGTVEILEYVKSNPGTKFMLCSTHNVYKGVLSALTLDHYFGLHERDAKRYAHHEAKRFAESLTAEYYRKYHLDARVVRVSDVYGPRMNLQAATDLTHLLKKAVIDDTLSIYGDGLKKLRPTYIHDVISGMSKAIFYEQSKGKIYTLVTDQEITVLECAYSIQKNSTKPLKIQFLPQTEEISFPSHKIELLQTQQELGWRPKKTFDEGITETLEYFYLQHSKHEKLDSANSAPNINAIQKDEITIRQQQTPLHLAKETALSPKTKFHPSHIFQLVGLGMSIFIVLVMAVFPYFAMHYYANTAANAISTNLGEAISNAKIASNQLKNLEWLFNIAQKRTELENSRALLNLLEESQSYTSELSYVKSITAQYIKSAISNNATAVTVSDLTQKINTLEIELLQSESSIVNEGSTLFSDGTAEKLQSIQKAYTQNHVELTQQALYLLKAQEILVSPQRTETDWFYFDNTQILASGVLTRNRTGILLSMDPTPINPTPGSPAYYLNKTGLNTLSELLGLQASAKDGVRQILELTNAVEQQQHKVNLADNQSKLQDAVQHNHLALYSDTGNCQHQNQLLQVSPPSTNGTCLIVQSDNLNFAETIVKIAGNKVYFESESLQSGITPEIQLSSNSDFKLTNVEYIYPRSVAILRPTVKEGFTNYTFPLETQSEDIATLKQNKIVLEIEYSGELDEQSFLVSLPFGSAVANRVITGEKSSYKTTGSRLYLPIISTSQAK